MLSLLKSEVNDQHAVMISHLTTGRSRTPTRQKQHGPQGTERPVVPEHSLPTHVRWLSVQGLSSCPSPKT